MTDLSFDDIQAIIVKFKSLNKYDEMVTKFEGKTGVLYLDSGNYFEID